MPPPRGTSNPLEGPGDYDVTSIIHNDTYPDISPLAQPATNKSIFIAGASRGIGLAITLSFARSGTSKIAIGARSPLASVKEAIFAAAKQAGRTAPQVLCVHLDISSPSSVSAAASAIEKEFGNLDILLINAGILGTPALIGESDPDDWWKTWEINLKGPYLVTRSFLPLLLRGGDKTIVTTSSVGAHLTSSMMSAYQTTKFAVLRLMEFVQAEYAEKGVVAFTIHPGNVLTDIVGGGEGVEKVGLTEVFVETPELSADSVVFLTREKREWLGGRYVNVTWDMPELIGMKDRIVEGDKLKVKLDFHM